jgi:hypothetical protein
MIDLEFKGKNPNTKMIAEELLTAIDEYVKRNPNSRLGKSLLSKISVKTYDNISNYDVK